MTRITRTSTVCILIASGAVVLFGLYVVSYPIFMRWKHGTESIGEMNARFGGGYFMSVDYPDEVLNPSSHWLYGPIEVAMDRSEAVRRSMTWIADQLDAPAVEQAAFSRKVRRLVDLHR